MKVLIITFGSRGDVQPYVALGRGLQAAGHRVTLCTAARFESFIREHDLEYGYMTDEFLQLIETDLGRNIIEKASGIGGIIHSVLKMLKYLKPITQKMIMDSWETAKAVEPDLIIFHPKILGAAAIAEKLGIPVVMANLQPIMVPTAEFPMAGMPSRSLGKRYNRATYRLVQAGLNMYRKTVNDFRQNTLHLDPVPKSSNMLCTAGGEPIPILHGYSPHVVPRPNDWPEQATVNGYWFLEPEASWQPSARLKSFLDAGEAPVYIGFGSMAGRNPRKLAQIAIEALTQAKLRGILATGWGGLEAEDLPEHILKIEDAPHEWLFPRTAAMVHHGGAGTTGAALRAGKPMTICPFIADQPFWGDHIHALGVGPKAIPQKKLTVQKLTRALQDMMHDTSMRDRAEELGRVIRDENGVESSVELIEGIFQR